MGCRHPDITLKLIRYKSESVPGSCVLDKMEEEALRNRCRRMTSRVREKQQLQSSEEHRHRAAGGRERRRIVAGDELRGHRESNLPLPDCTAREGDRTSLSLACQGPEAQPVPPQLISMLRLKTLKEQMRRVRRETLLRDFFSL